MPNNLQTTREGFVDVNPPRKNLMNLFIILMGASAIVYFVLGLIMGREAGPSIFFVKGGDFFMDTFNSIRDASQGPAVYSERHVIYPPMANLIFLVLSRFTLPAYNDTTFKERYSWSDSGVGLIFVMVTLAICVIATFALIHKALKRGSENRRTLFAVLMTLSVPILYVLERGNILILCVMSLLVYAITYNSESKISRELGLLALAFAFSVKLYPVVFGWFLIVDKRYKEAIRCAIYGVAMVILPSFFFGGPIFCLTNLYRNITGWSSGSGNDIVSAMNALNFPDTAQSAVNALIYAWVLICAACFVLSSFFRTEKKWKTWALGVATILCVPSLSSLYAWSFMLIPLIMLVNSESATPKYITYTTLMTIPFMFVPVNLLSLNMVAEKLIPGIVMRALPFSIVWNYVITATFSIFIVVDTFVELRRFLAERKKAKVAGADSAEA